MRTTIYGKHVWECDACGETLQTDTPDYSEALQHLRDAKWRAQQIGSDWVHACFGCKDKGARDERARAAGRIP